MDESKSAYELVKRYLEENGEVKIGFLNNNMASHSMMNYPNI